MKSAPYLLAGSLVVNALGCDLAVSALGYDSEYKEVGKYSCELLHNGYTITARNGEKFAEFYDGNNRDELRYWNLTSEEALKAVKTCSEAFGKKIE